MKGLSRYLPMSGALKKRRYVFILTYGRSGSTLLMNLINSREGCCIRGENNGALYSIYKSYKSIIDAQQHHAKNSLRQSSPWWGLKSIDPDRYAQKLVRSFVEEVLRPDARDLVCGFKEIRYSKKDVPDLAEYMGFMERLFPEAKFVFNHRKLEDVAKSKWWSSMPQAMNLLQEFDSRLYEFPASSTRFHFSYDSAMQNRAHVRELFNFLDLPYDEAEIRKVFAEKHSY